jgi:hypothetical protein
MMNRFSLTATRFNATLLLSLFLVSALAAVSFYFISRSLNDYAVEVSHSVVDASASQDNLQTLDKIKTQLTTDSDIVERANSIVADSKSYQYQDQILNDLNDYAKKAGVEITAINFSTTNQQAAASAPASGTANAVEPLLPNGLKSTSASVSLQNPVNYNNLLRFIKSIEQNLTKMQISKIALSKGSSGTDVTTDILTIEVYVR